MRPGVHCRVLLLTASCLPDRIVVLKSTEFRIKDDSRLWTSHTALTSNAARMTATSTRAAAHSCGLTFASSDTHSSLDSTPEVAPVFVRHSDGNAALFRGVPLFNCMHDLVPVDSDEGPGAPSDA